MSQELADHNSKSELVRVLLVEDNPGDALLLREALSDVEMKGLPASTFELVHVTRLEHGLKRLTEGGIDVVLLDLSLPDGQGLDTVARTHAAAPDAPIVVLTGLDDEALAIQAVQVGAQDYLVKGQILSNLLVRAMRYAIERSRLRAELRSLSLKDELTGLYNRRGFLTLAEQHLKLACRTQTGLLLVFADLDGLKQINDTFGHQQGDRVLIKAAEILKGTFRDSDILARWGGDEFAVLAVDDSSSSAETITDRLQQELKAYNAKSNPYELSLSMGVARFDPAVTSSIEEPMAIADKALYEHKRSKWMFARGL